MQTTFFASATLSASGLLLAALPGQRIRVHGLALVALAATAVKLQSASTDITGSFSLAANGGFVLPFSEVGWAQTSPSEALNVVMSSSTTVGIQLIYSLV